LYRGIQRVWKIPPPKKIKGHDPAADREPGKKAIIEMHTTESNQEKKVPEAYLGEETMSGRDSSKALYTGRTARQPLTSGKGWLHCQKFRR